MFNSFDIAFTTVLALVGMCFLSSFFVSFFFFFVSVAYKVKPKEKEKDSFKISMSKTRKNIMNKIKNEEVPKMAFSYL